MQINCVISKFLIKLAVNLTIMATFKISDRLVRPCAIGSSVIYACLAALYFTQADIPGKTALPLAFLTLVSLWMCPWKITVALLSSALGDLAGEYGNLNLQMGSFVLTHIMLIWFLFERYRTKVERDGKLTEKAMGYTLLIGLLCIFIAGAAFTQIVMNIPAGIIRIGAGTYVLLICLMLGLALLQRSSLYALGAVLFVCSDFILGWNMFTEPIENSKWLIMVPYYMGQWLIYIRSTSFRVAPETRLMRF